MVSYPTGDQHEIVAGETRATVVEVGGGLRVLSTGGVDLIDGYPSQESPTGARGTSLVPWPNRLADGKYTWQGQDLQVALTEPSKHNAIHGLARWQSWPLRDRTDSSVTLGHVLHPQTGFPFLLDLTVTYTVSTDGLETTTTATNLGEQVAPWATGCHPYLTVGTDHVDAAVLTVPAASYVAVDDRGLPTGVEAVDGTQYDFRSGRLIGDTKIDVPFLDLVRDADGRAEARLSTSDHKRSVVLWVDQTYPYIEIYTGDTLPPDKRRRGVGCEPMSAPPNAFASGIGVVRLEPGATSTHHWGIHRS